MSIEVFYFVSGLLSIILTTYSIIYLKNKTNNRGVLSFIMVLSLYLLASICYVYFLLDSDNDESYILLLSVYLAKFVAIQSLFIFSRCLKYGNSATLHNFTYLLGLIQCAFSSAAFYQDNFLLVEYINGNALYTTGYLYIINDILAIVLTAVSYYIVYQMLSKYKRSFVISSTITLLMCIIVAGLSIFSHNFPLVSIITYFCCIYNIMLFVFILEKLYIDSNETDSDILEFVKASYVVVDSEENYVSSTSGFKPFGSGTKYNTFKHFINDIVEVEKDMFTFNDKFYHIIDGGVYNRLQHKIYYFQDVTANFNLKKSYYSKHLIDTLTGCNTRYNLIENYKHIKSFKGYIIGYFDIDRFKHINDTYSHDVGDIYIKHFATYLIDTFGFDNVYRLGGDEFIVISNKHTITDFEPKIIPGPNYENIDIDIEYSVGSLKLDSRSDKDIHNHITVAERAMYVCKNSKKER